ncbi:protein RoBo-1-like isoform X2 [Alosa sapidissima]|nr:protein RoBo-1-like isoform X2 [Alosa sapidissima]
MPYGTGPCKDITICPPTTYCGNLRVATFAGGQVISDMAMKSCVVPQQCIVGSYNVGKIKKVINSKCCMKDDCNNGTVEASTGVPNGKECHTCIGSDCSSKLKCEGEEDRCLIAKLDVDGEKMTGKGCASKSICTMKMRDQMEQGLADMTCCEGYLCNSTGEVNRNSITIMVLSIACFLFLH